VLSIAPKTPSLTGLDFTLHCGRTPAQAGREFFGEITMTMKGCNHLREKAKMEANAQQVSSIRRVQVPLASR